MNKEILAKAEEIIKHREEEKRYLETCRKAGICPVCGSTLEQKHNDTSGYYAACSQDESHYSLEYDEDDFYAPS